MQKASIVEQLIGKSSSELDAFPFYVPRTWVWVSKDAPPILTLKIIREKNSKTTPFPPLSELPAATPPILRLLAKYTS